MNGFCRKLKQVVEIYEQSPGIMGGLFVCSGCGVLDTKEKCDNHAWSLPGWFLWYICKLPDRKPMLEQIRQQQIDIYEKTAQFCDTVILGKKQSLKLCLEVANYPVRLPVRNLGFPRRVLGMRVIQHPTLDGVVVLPVLDEGEVT